ncbi:hypothetical protein GLOIN_2v1786023 [Rhizophagus irregularis DAOM 181602=DAOM 197198]|nr:hypothetical protein GLOIN_2v1786023 [Rhizophagus irregularis DAOM 181602=DAOM 197198]
MSPSLSYFYPESITECQRFCVYLRKLNFLNLMETKTDFKSLGGESKLSDQLKNFSNLAKKARQEYIIEVFYKKSSVFSLVFTSSAME